MEASGGVADCDAQELRLTFGEAIRREVLTGAKALDIQNGGSRETTVVHADAPLRRNIVDVSLDERLADWVARQAHERHGIAIDTGSSPPLSSVDSVLSSLNDPGRYIAYVGATQVKLPFTIACDGRPERRGVVVSWKAPVAGALGCTVAPPAEDEVGSAARRYC